MRPEMTMFLIETALKGNKIRTRRSSGIYDLGIFNPTHQWPKYQSRPGMMDRPMFEGHKTYPHLSRPGAGGATFVLASHVAAPVAVVGTSVVGASLVTDAYSVLEPENVNEKRSFWMGLSAAMSGGFSMGGQVW